MNDENIPRLATPLLSSPLKEREERELEDCYYPLHRCLVSSNIVTRFVEVVA